MTKLEARQRDLETSTSCVFRSNSQGQGRHDRGRQSLRVDGSGQSPHARFRRDGGEGTEAVEVPAEGRSVCGGRSSSRDRVASDGAETGASGRLGLELPCVTWVRHA